jgi:hypothetical protein
VTVPVVVMVVVVGIYCVTVDVDVTVSVVVHTVEVTVRVDVTVVVTCASTVLTGVTASKGMVIRIIIIIPRMSDAVTKRFLTFLPCHPIIP